MEKLTKKKIEELIEQGYNIIKGDRNLPHDDVIFTPAVKNDLWEQLDTLDEEVGRVLVLNDMLKWEDSQIFEYLA